MTNTGENPNTSDPGLGRRQMLKASAAAGLIAPSVTLLGAAPAHAAACSPGTCPPGGPDAGAGMFNATCTSPFIMTVMESVPYTYSVANSPIGCGDGGGGAFAITINLAIPAIGALPFPTSVDDLTITFPAIANASGVTLAGDGTGTVAVESSTGNSINYVTFQIDAANPNPVLEGIVISGVASTDMASSVCIPAPSAVIEALGENIVCTPAGGDLLCVPIC